MAISTFKVFLMRKVLSTWEKLIDIKEFPDLGGDPEMLETTTLSDKMQTYIPGIQTMDGLSFVSNYTLEDYEKLKALEGQEEEYAVWFGGTETAGVLTPNGEHGKYAFPGQLTTYPTGGGVNEVVNLNTTIAPSAPIQLVS